MELLLTQLDPCNAASFPKPKTLDFLGGTLIIRELQLQRRQPKKMHCWRNITRYILRRIEKVTRKVGNSVLQRAANKDSHSTQKTFSLQEHT